jgi:16S rRNA (guanine527-N7)-methyltransferase
VTDNDAPLLAGADTLGLHLDDTSIWKLCALLDLLGRWNAVYNLTALKTRAEWISLHVLDSLSVSPHLRGERMLDAGSGPGFPGLPLAIAHPEQSWTLVDSNQKKTAFAAQAAAELGLRNVTVHQARVETLRAPVPYDVIISRAFADLADFARLAGHLVADTGRLAAMKGKVDAGEIERVPETFRCERVVPLAIPGVDAERHLILMKPNRHQGQ